MLSRHPTIHYLCAHTYIIKEYNHETKKTKKNFSKKRQNNSCFVCYSVVLVV